MQHAAFNNQFNGQFDDQFSGQAASSTHPGFAGRSGGQRSNSLVAFLAAIRFLRSRGQSPTLSQARSQEGQRGFARPQPQARQGIPVSAEADCVRSAN